jgi:hypothetical protein
MEARAWEGMRLERVIGVKRQPLHAIIGDKTRELPTKYHVILNLSSFSFPRAQSRRSP